MSFIRSIAMFALALCVSGVAQEITIKGSTTLQPAAERWATEFSKSNPGLKVRVLGGGTGKGFEALTTGEAQIAAASRGITPEERTSISAKRGKAPVEFKVGMDGVAVFVHSANAVSALTMEQIADIFSGKVTNWSQVGGKDEPIHVYNRDANSGTFGFMKEHLLKGKNFAAAATTVAGSSQIAVRISSDAAGIGYGSVEFSKGIKALKVRAKAGAPAVSPELANIRNGEYALSRPLFLYSAGTPNETARQFLDFVASQKGQAILETSGLFSLSGADRTRLLASVQ